MYFWQNGKLTFAYLCITYIWVNFDLECKINISSSMGKILELKKICRNSTKKRKFSKDFG